LLFPAACAGIDLEISLVPPKHIIFRIEHFYCQLARSGFGITVRDRYMQYAMRIGGHERGNRPASFRSAQPENREGRYQTSEKQDSETNCGSQQLTFRHWVLPRPR